MSKDPAMSALRKLKPMKPVLALLTVALLAGCADRGTTVGSIPDDYRTNHPIVISEKEQVADIPVGHADNRLSITQRRMAAWRSAGSPSIMSPVLNRRETSSVSSVR